MSEDGGTYGCVNNLQHSWATPHGFEVITCADRISIRQPGGSRCGHRPNEDTKRSEPSPGMSSTALVFDNPLSSRRRAESLPLWGKGEISGDLTKSEAQRLAQAIDFGVAACPSESLVRPTVMQALGSSRRGGAELQNAGSRQIASHGKSDGAVMGPLTRRLRARPAST
jgi:hypothetical protein